MLLTCNGISALRGRVSLSALRGWSAELELDAEAFPTGPVTLSGGGASMVGRAWRSNPYRGISFVQVVGGAGGMGTTIPAAAYRIPTVRHVVADILRDAGEALSPASDPIVLARTLDAWSRAKGTAGAALDAVCDAVGSSWSVGDNGLVAIGSPTWLELPTLDAVELSRDELHSRALYGLETFSIRPGFTIGGVRITGVDYLITSGTTRAEVEFYRREAGDRLGSVLGAFIAKRLAPTAYHAAYAASVLSQNADGTLELRLDSDRVKAPSKVPIVGLPGVSVKVTPSARCIVTFVDGDPMKARAELFDPTSLDTITINAATKIIANAPDVELGAGAAPVVRVGDTISVGTTGGVVAMTTPFSGVPTKVKA